MRTAPAVHDSLSTTHLLEQFQRHLGGWRPARKDTLQEERHEVLDCILESLRWGDGDPEARAACRFLLRHLAVTPSQC